VEKNQENLRRREGFTIIELLTVMSIIIILISILVPAMRKAKIFAKEVQQRNQFKAINTGLEMFHNDFEEYPESSEDQGTTGTNYYCGAMKLAEAMVGQDLLGFHPHSRFRADGTDGPPNYNLLYQRGTSGTPPDAYNQELREGPYLELGNANAHRLRDVYLDTGNFYEEVFVLLDVYSNVENNSPMGRPWIGMPILYYKANTSGNGHPYFINNDPAAGEAGSPAPQIDDSTNYYNYKDNDFLVQLGIPFVTSDVAHLMALGGQATRHNFPMDLSKPHFFYHNTYDENVPLPTGQPHRPDSFILLSAGYDGEYGTTDDITNFPQ
jgi:type II secretory pathway pseudopilin PulG